MKKVEAWRWVFLSYVITATGASLRERRGV